MKAMQPHGEQGPCAGPQHSMQPKKAQVLLVNCLAPGLLLSPVPTLDVGSRHSDMVADVPAGGGMTEVTKHLRRQNDILSARVASKEQEAKRLEQVATHM